MKKSVVVTASILSVALFATAGLCDVAKGGKVDAKAEFTKHCSSCHPNGGNIVNPKKTLGKKALTANGIKTEKDIVGKMRNPGPGMTHFDAKTLPDNEALAIAKYIMTTFK